MADTLFFRQSADSFEWLKFNGQGQLLAAGESQLAEIEVDGHAIFVVPGADVLHTTAVVPSRQYRQILQAVPYVIEESLAVDIEACFFALGDRTAQDEIEVAVVDLELMRTWYEEIATSHLDVAVVVTEHDLVNAGSRNAVLLDEGRAHIDLQNNASVTLPEGELALAAEVLEEGVQLDIWSASTLPQKVDLQLKELEAAGVQVERLESAETPFERLCRGYTGAEINLLQGPFKRQERQSSRMNVWRSVAVLAAAALFLHIAGLAGQGWYLQTKASEFEDETRALYAAIFPEDRNVRDIRRRWNAHLGKQQTTDGGFISLLSRSTRQLDGSGLTLININFNESRGDLVLQVIGKQSEALVEYSQALISMGLDAEIGTITQDDDGVRGSVRVGDS